MKGGSVTLVGVRGTDQGREVVLVTGGSLVIRDGLETEKRRAFRCLCALTNCFSPLDGRNQVRMYFSMWEDAMREDHAAVRSI